MKVLLLTCVSIVLVISGCAQTSPKQEVAVSQMNDGKAAKEIFEATFERHGGNNLSALSDVNVAVDGKWHFLITKIQPDVTDHNYREQSEERILLSPRVYAADYRGDAGNKRVFRSEQHVDVAYNGDRTSDTRKEAAAALTADAFYLFVLGPLALSDRVVNWQRLNDGAWKGQSYYRINGEMDPGIGFSNSDYITLWIYKASFLTFRLHITLEGFESTKGAHVDTTYRRYTDIGPFTLPTHFFERVVGPIKLDAHEWWYTGIDINRGLNQADIDISGWSAKAASPAKKISAPNAANSDD